MVGAEATTLTSAIAATVEGSPQVTYLSGSSANRLLTSLYQPIDLMG